ncbi:MAG: site-specific integrase [Candidatus Marinimicrobia bacterium]|nr:site-specific integrase [Candidatus Neomarinimicrobiota bacterium]
MKLLILQLQIPNTQIKPIRFLTLDEIKRLLGAIDDQNIKDMVLMYINTGARAREIDKKIFTWSNVDFKTKRINFLGKGNKYRNVPMNEAVLKILKRRKNVEKREVPFDTEYDYMYRRVKKGYLKAGIKNAGVHTLRKTFGSLLVQNGVNIYTVSKLMGHGSVTVTEKHYAELLDENLRSGVQQLDDILM